MHTQDKVVKPWYKEFWAWFILSPLILVVVVSSITVSIAVKNADDRVIDNYYKEGRMINMRLDEDILAASLRISSVINFAKDIDEATLTLEQSDAAFPEKLILELSHPVQAELDIKLVFTQVVADQYHTELPPNLMTQRWYLRLSPIFSDPEKLRWRLRGEINFADTNSIVLKADDSLLRAEGSLLGAEGSLLNAEGSLPSAEGSLPKAEGSP